MSELSEEEIIKCTKNIINATYIEATDTDEDGNIIEQGLVNQEVIQGLLDLYQKEKKKNEELENADLTTVYMNGFYDGEKKWKDKIKEKIEEYNTAISKNQTTYSLSKMQEIEFAIRSMGELLEERN